VLLRLAYLGVTNAFAVLRLLPMSDRDKDVEILTLRHQLGMLEQQLGTTKVRFDGGDRAFLAALLHRLSRDVLRRVRLLVARTRCCAGSAREAPGRIPDAVGRNLKERSWV
jgi:putative transposase